MENSELDALRESYQNAVEEWIAAIREEAALATVDHSVTAVDLWEQAGFREEQARGKAKTAKKAYEDSLRQAIFDI